VADAEKTADRTDHVADYAGNRVTGFADRITDDVERTTDFVQPTTDELNALTDGTDDRTGRAADGLAGMFKCLAAFGDQAAGGIHCVAARAKHVVNRTRDMFDRSCSLMHNVFDDAYDGAFCSANDRLGGADNAVGSGRCSDDCADDAFNAVDRIGDHLSGCGAGALNGGDRILRRGGRVGDRRDEVADILSSLTADRFGSGMCGRLGERLNRVKPGLCGVSRSGRTAEHQAKPGARQIAHHGFDRAGGITDHPADIATDRVADFVDRGTCCTPRGVAGGRGTVLDEIAGLIENYTGIAANGVTDGVEGVACGAKRAVRILVTSIV
jgi:hypothetical protein